MYIYLILGLFDAIELHSYVLSKKKNYILMSSYFLGDPMKNDNSLCTCSISY